MVSVDTMAIAHGEKVQSQLTEHVRYEDISILIRLVWVAWLVADRGCKGKLCDAVEALGCYFNW